MLSGCMRACATKIPGCTDTPCSIHGRSGAFRDGYNLNHLNGSVEQHRLGVARSGERADFPSPRHSGHACGWPAGEHQSGAARQFGNAPRRPNGDSGDFASCRRDRAARPAAEGLDGRAEETAHCSAALTPPPGAERPMHSTRAQDAAEPRIADFRRSPSGRTNVANYQTAVDQRNPSFRDHPYYYSTAILQRYPPKRSTDIDRTNSLLGGFLFSIGG